jgi:hypothetical protein
VSLINRLSGLRVCCPQCHIASDQTVQTTRLVEPGRLTAIDVTGQLYPRDDSLVLIDSEAEGPCISCGYSEDWSVLLVLSDGRLVGATTIAMKDAATIFPTRAWLVLHSATNE